ncbi:hypothetical protein QTG54_006265 [Skeletonema marinoi]|uniref:Uncharacterized protein n=1 Tax=Skeletonema marinoi TaxID=267567 RepID=A0AAD8YBE5_9STRA|nr:hypothetical protein QTG54_006265 [Skeletonema marinoi]
MFSFLLPSSLAIDTQVCDKFSLLRFSELEYEGYSNRIERWASILSSKIRLVVR